MSNILPHINNRQFLERQLMTKLNINLEINKQEVLISHIEIATQTKVDKKNVKEQIEKYKVELQSFGTLRFETASLTNPQIDLINWSN